MTTKTDPRIDALLQRLALRTDGLFRVDEVRQLLNEVSDVLSPSVGWHPIESAPKDRRIMLWRAQFADSCPSVGWWAEAVESDSDGFDNSLNAGWFSEGGSWPSGDEGDQPTHWAEIPSFPA